MAFLRDMSDRFWSYVSPRKTQQRRDKPFKVPAIPLKKGKMPVRDTIEMSPETRIQRWAVRSPSFSGSVDEAQLPPSPPTSLERPYTDYEGETLLDDIADQMNPEDEQAWDANEETIVVDDGQYMEEQKAIDPEAERMRREAQGRDLRAAGWTEDAIFLFHKLGMRGFEPLMPDDWINDFGMLPMNLFTMKIDKAFIKPTFGSDFHAQKALSDLFQLGGFARDAVLTKAPIRTAEDHIRRSINKYNKWAMKDGKLDICWKNISLFETISCHKNVHPSVMEGKMIRKLGRLAGLWRDAFNTKIQENSSNSETFQVDVGSVPDLPTLYGICASHTVMAFVSYDSLSPSPSLRTVAMFDFGQEAYDVWNCLAIAIFVIHCRNRLMELKDSLPKAEVKKDSDPDL